jgi:hypothetical protein
MPRYYFHVRRGRITVLDHEGIELAHTIDAEVEAVKRAQQVVNRKSGQSSNDALSRGAIIVADDNWQTLFEIPF